MQLEIIERSLFDWLK